MRVFPLLRSQRRSAQLEAGSSTGEPRTGPASARLPRAAPAANADGARSTPTSARGAAVPSTATADVSAAKQWLKAQGRQRPAGSSKQRSGGEPDGTDGQRDEQRADCRGERRVLVAAAAGYEGEAAVVAIAHIMQQGLSPHEALVAASQRHVALHVCTHPLCDPLFSGLLASCRAMNSASVADQNMHVSSPAQPHNKYCRQVGDGRIVRKADDVCAFVQLQEHNRRQMAAWARIARSDA